MATQTDTMIETLAKQRQAATGGSYAQAYAEVLEENPHLYDEAVSDSQARHMTERQAQQSRQFDEGYRPGRGVERAVDDQLDKEARRIQASEGCSYAQAYSTALERDPQLYDHYAQGALIRQIAAAGGTVPDPAPRQFADSDPWTSSSTPAGISRQNRSSALQSEINDGLAPLQRRYAAAPRDVLLALLFDQDATLRSRCINLARSLS